VRSRENRPKKTTRALSRPTQTIANTFGVDLADASAADSPRGGQAVDDEAEDIGDLGESLPLSQKGGSEHGDPTNNSLHDNLGITFKSL